MTLPDDLATITRECSYSRPASEGDWEPFGVVMRRRSGLMRLMFSEPLASVLLALQPTLEERERYMKA